ncbi:hypothetical protein J2Y59_004174 [Arcicella sp. BE139]|nr:hypothetical protein [Arcicella sp. BE139]
MSNFLKLMLKQIHVFLMLLLANHLQAQNQYELNGAWKCAPIKSVKENGEVISSPHFFLSGWKPAVVPGTVLTSMLANKEIPDPFYGLNNEKIPDIYNTGRDYYTYWFAKDFKEVSPTNGSEVWLKFRGINYACDVFLNGKKVNEKVFEGMFLRQSFNITKLLAKDGNNRLAVIVYPPYTVGNANGGQGGDGTIAKNVSLQYTAGWDWIRPIRDRNTGIWDKVYIEKTGKVNLKDPHVITLVPEKRLPDAPQKPAIIKASADLENTSSVKVEGTLVYTIDGNKVSKKVSLAPNSTTTVNLDNYSLKNPRLWWPAGYGKQELYDTKFELIVNGQVSDQEAVKVGVREIQTDWNALTASRQIYVNGQKVFIKGGNWIISDAMLRFSDERYDAEIRFHRDMNLNLIRIWGGALVERPEFYEACDRYGLLVFQDFWMSGDCNGRWVDPMKKEDQWTRRNYPDNHQLFLSSAADMIKMVRNHPSLAIWCGGNEITPPEDILVPLRDEILPKLDGTRWFIDYSNSDEMSFNSLGGNGDGPYGIQPLDVFWNQRTFPFNSEVGSVGTGDYESLKRFIPKENLNVPYHDSNQKPDSVWTYHTYTGVGYNQFIDPYGKPKDIKDFGLKAQLVNYDQYRGLIEGFSSHIWEWYTGVIIWKTQNPWTAMRGQMYDYYLDPNACLYGLKSGSELVHIMANPVDGMLMMVNNDFKPRRNLMLVAKAYDINGKVKEITQVFTFIEASSVKKILSVKKVLEEIGAEEGSFLSLQLLDENKQIVSDNMYWYPNSKGVYSGLQKMKSVENLKVAVKSIGTGKVQVTMSNPANNPVAFFNRVSIVDERTKERILPVFYNDNYVSIAPGAEKTIIIDNVPLQTKPQVSIEGWNYSLKYFNIQ